MLRWRGKPCRQKKLTDDITKPSLHGVKAMQRSPLVHQQRKKMDHMRTEGSAYYKEEREKKIMEASSHPLPMAKALGDPLPLPPSHYLLTLGNEEEPKGEVHHRNSPLVPYP